MYYFFSICLIFQIGVSAGAEAASLFILGVGIDIDGNAGDSIEGMKVKRRGNENRTKLQGWK
jgi:hypothetical protein